MAKQKGGKKRSGRKRAYYERQYHRTAANKARRAARIRRRKLEIPHLPKPISD